MARNWQAELKTEKANHPERGAERAARNRARLKLVKAHGAAAMKGKQVEHKDGNPLNNSLSNLKPVSPKANNQGRRGGPAKQTKKR